MADREIKTNGCTADNYERVIAAHCGTGKTWLANARPDEFIDFSCMPYKYYPMENLEGEASKASNEMEVRPFWQVPYADAIRIALDITDKTLLIPPDALVLDVLKTWNIPHTLCYPERTAKDAYRKRFVERGNTESFLSVFIDCWDEFIDSMEQNITAQHIVLKTDEYLNDVLSLQDDRKQGENALVFKSESLEKKFNVKLKGIRDLKPIADMCNKNHLSFGYFSEKDTLELQLPDGYLYRDAYGIPIHAEGKYEKFLDISYGVTELENTIKEDYEYLLEHKLDVVYIKTATHKGALCWRSYSREPK